MFIVHTYGLAVVLCVLTMLCWGSWPNTQKLAERSWRFELFYWDYILGILLVSVLLAFTLGSAGGAGRSFMADLAQASQRACLSAALGGVIFNAGNILFVAAIALAGMSVAFPVGGGLGLVLGVVINYLALPLGSGPVLFAGVALIILAMIFSALSYRRLAGGGGGHARGILLAVAAGILFGFFYRFIAASMAADFVRPAAGWLTPYTAVCFFSAGALASNLAFNTLLMRRPLAGRPVGYGDYFRGSLRNHGMGIAGGAIWGLGLGLSILSAGQAGYAISFGLGQGNALIAALWGVFVWKEFAGARRRSAGLLACMFACYVAGLALIIVSRGA